MRCNDEKNGVKGFKIFPNIDGYEILEEHKNVENILIGNTIKIKNSKPAYIYIYTFI
jgi:hypothetical protein